MKYWQILKKYSATGNWIINEDKRLNKKGWKSLTMYDNNNYINELLRISLLNKNIKLIYFFVTFFFSIYSDFGWSPSDKIKT